MIDKSLGQYQQLVKKGKGNRRPGYRGDNWGGPSYGGSSSRSNGGDRSHDRGGGQHQAAAQRATPAPSPHRDDSAERAAQAAADALNAQRAEAERANQLAEARKLMTQPVTVDVPIKGPELIPGTTGPVTLDPYKQNYISPGLVEIEGGYKTGDYDKLVEAPIDVGFQEALRKQQIATDLRQKQQDPDYGQFFRQPPVVEKPSGIMGTIKDKSVQMAKDFATRKAMKALGLTAWNPVVGIGSWLLDKFAPGKKAALKSNITNLLTSKSDDLVGTPDWQGEQKRKKTFHEGKGDGDKQQVTTVQEAVAGKGLAEGQKMLGIDEIKKRHSLLQTTLNDGYYVDNKGRNIQLNDQQKAMLTDYISQIDKYLVNVDTRTMSAYGGRIDKALGGRSRDI